jgi:hypothetical protein
MERPILTLDLQGPEGNVFVVIGRARELLTGLMMEHFNTDIGKATLIDEGTTYKDVLEIVNRYVRLIDRSGLYSEYAIDQEAITAAICHLNEQLQTLPDDVPCSLEDLHPDFDDPDCDAYVYMAMLMLEIQDTEQDIELVCYDNAEPLRRLLTMLRECASALERAGVESLD